MRHYDSRAFPFLTGLLFDELLNFDWRSSWDEIKRIEEAEKKMTKNLPEKHQNKDDVNKNGCYYLQYDTPMNENLRFYTPEFKLEDGVYTYETNLGKDVKPEDIKIDASLGTFHLSYSSETENGTMSAATLETLPKDIDIDTMKAVFKNGKLTITAKQKPEEVEEKNEERSDEVEFEIEIGK